MLDDIKSAGVKFIKELRSQDRAMIVALDYDVHVLSQLTSDRKALERAMKNATTGEQFGTVLRDAVADVIERSFKRVDGRKAIIVLTDGKDAGSRISEQALLDEAAESGAMIYTVFFETGFLDVAGLTRLVFRGVAEWDAIAFLLREGLDASSGGSVLR